MSKHLSGFACIAGYGDAYATPENPKTVTELATEALLSLLEKTRIDRSRIGAVFTGRTPISDPRPQWNNVISSYFQLQPNYSTEVTSHGAGVNAALGYSTAFLAAGLVDYCLVFMSDVVEGSARFVEEIPTMDANPEFEYPYGPSIPSIYALGASRYCHDYGVTPEDLAHVAVGHQAWAVHHPYSAKGRKGEITVDTVLQSRLIADPLHLWDAAIWGPYGTAGAILVTTEERARDIAEKPVYIRGFGGLNTHEYATDRLALRKTPHDLGPLPNTTYSGARIASRLAYEMAGIGPRDIGMVQCGNNFTHVALMMMEDLGFAEKGQGAQLARSGRLWPGGDLPWNTNGGWLSFGQTGGMCQMDPIIEALRQFDGKALGLQIPDPGNVLTHALGGMMACHHVTILSH